MTFVRNELRDAAVGVGVADTPEGLDAIHKPGCAATIWRRQPMPGFQSWIDDLDPACLPSTRCFLRPDKAINVVRDLFDGTGIAYCAERFWLESDVIDLAERFAAIMQSPYLRLRLDKVTTNACRRFHVDAIKARLICTYRGSGTQYGISVDGNKPRRVFQVATGAPMILRGSLWPESPLSGLLHRSPPIEGTGETRLVLVLDPVFDMESDT